MGRRAAASEAGTEAEGREMSSTSRRALLTVLLVGMCWVVGAVMSFYEFAKYFGVVDPKFVMPRTDMIIETLSFALSPPLWFVFNVNEGMLSGSGDAAMIPRIVVQTAVQAVVIYSIVVICTLYRSRRTSHPESN